MKKLNNLCESRFLKLFFAFISLSLLIAAVCMLPFADYGVLVPHGVYCGYSCVDGETFPAVLNIGPAPTYNVEQTRVEIHLLGFNGTLYGRELPVYLVKKLRDIRKFASPQELKEQIMLDIASAREATSFIEK